jgi:hypothetical protein
MMTNDDKGVNNGSFMPWDGADGRRLCVGLRIPSLSQAFLDDSDSYSVKDSSAVGRLASEFYIDFPFSFFPRRVLSY